MSLRANDADSSFMRLPRYARAATAVQSLRKVDLRSRNGCGARLGLGRAVALILDERIEADADPDGVERRGGKGAVQAAVDDEADGADDIHALIEPRAPAAPATREQHVRADDERGTDPPDDFHCELQEASNGTTLPGRGL